MKKEWGRGMIAGAIGLMVLLITVMCGMVLSIIRIFSATQNGVNVPYLVVNILILLAYISLVIYGFFSYRKGTVWYIPVILFEAILTIFTGIIFPFVEANQNAAVFGVVVALSVIAALSCIALCFTLSKRKIALVVLLVLLVSELTISILSTIFFDSSSLVKGFDIFLMYTSMFSQFVLSIAVVASYFVMGAKKKSINY